MYVKTVNVAEARIQLSALLDEAARTHEEVTITRNGHPIVVLVSSDEYEAMQETIFWLSRGAQSTQSEQIAVEKGDYVTSDQLHTELISKGIISQ